MPCFTDLTYAANPVEEVVIERDPHQPHILMARHPDTRLIIGMARWIDAMSLLRKPPFSALSCYALTGQTSVAFGVTEVNGAHIGRSGQLPVRARRHRRTPPLDTPMAMTVITIEGGFLLQEAAALERRLHEVARGGDYVVVSQTPSDPGLSATVLARAERWIGTLHWILPLLGCGILQEADDGRPAPVLALGPDAAPGVGAGLRAGWTTHIPEHILAHPGGERYRLQAGDVTATLRVVEGWHVVEPGSTVRAVPPGYIQPGVQAKRETLRDAGIFQPVPGREDIWQVARPLTLPSLTNAARLVLASNSRWRVWKEVA